MLPHPPPRCDRAGSRDGGGAGRAAGAAVSASHPGRDPSRRWASRRPETCAASATRSASPRPPQQMAASWELSASPPAPERLGAAPAGRVAGVICPHDDYLYAGRVYRQVLPLVTARTVVLVGVFHKYRRFGVHDGWSSTTTAPGGRPTARSPSRRCATSSRRGCRQGPPSRAPAHARPRALARGARVLARATSDPTWRSCPSSSRPRRSTAFEAARGRPRRDALAAVMRARDLEARPRRGRSPSRPTRVHYGADFSLHAVRRRRRRRLRQRVRPRRRAAHRSARRRALTHEKVREFFADLRRPR